MKKLITVIMICVLYHASHAQNIGIGVSDPSQKLDVGGSIRLQKTGTTPGRMTASTTGVNNLTFGNIDDNTMGISTGNSWPFALNVTSGNVGIGTTAPTAKLDINTSLRIRQSAAAGATLQAIDGNGLTKWINPCAFRVSGLTNGALGTLKATYISMQKFTFLNTEYETSNVWQADYHEFKAPYNGVYHFSFKILFVDSDQLQTIHLMKRENGIEKTLVEKETMKYWVVQPGTPSESIWGDQTITICADVKLAKGDAVFVYGEGFGTWDGSPASYYFTGQLVSLL